MPAAQSKKRVGPARGRRLPPVGQDRRRQRVLRERVQHVGQQQFLVLLLVLQAEFHQRRVGGRRA